MKKIIRIYLTRQPDELIGNDARGEFAVERPDGAYYVIRQEGTLHAPDSRTLARLPHFIRPQQTIYSYFLPGTNHVPHSPGNWSHVSAKERDRVEKEFGSIAAADYQYALQDWQRMEQRERGHWCYLRIQSVAEIAASENGQTWLCCGELCSGGLGGIESDSDEDYLRQVEREELESLCAMLQEFGFTEDEIREQARKAQPLKG